MKRTLAFALLALAACEENADYPAQPTEAPAQAPAPAPADPGADMATAAPTGGDAAATPAEPAAVKSARRFLEVKGEVTLDGKPAAVDMPIGESATIATGADGHAVISVVAGSLIEVRAKSRLELGKSERKTISAKLLAGALWSFLPPGSSYEVQTDNAVAGVRGTIFFVEKAPKSTYVCDCNGEVEIYPGKAKKPTVFQSAHAHKAVRVFGKVSKKAGRENHTDAQMAELLKIVPEASNH